MKLAFPVSEKSVDSNIHETFGRAPYYLIYDTNSKEISYLDHRAVVAQGASGFRAAEVLADNGIKAVITLQCGENAEKILRNAEVLVYEAMPGTIKENLEAFNNSKLSLLDKFIQRNPGSDV